MSDEGVCMSLGVMIGVVFSVLAVGLYQSFAPPEENQLYTASKSYAVSTVGDDAERAKAKGDFDKAVQEYVKSMKEKAR